MLVVVGSPWCAAAAAAAVAVSSSSVPLLSPSSASLAPVLISAIDDACLDSCWCGLPRPSADLLLCGTAGDAVLAGKRKG